MRDDYHSKIDEGRNMKGVLSEDLKKIWTKFGKKRFIWKEVKEAELGIEISPIRFRNELGLKCVGRDELRKKIYVVNTDCVSGVPRHKIRKKVHPQGYIEFGGAD